MQDLEWNLVMNMGIQAVGTGDVPSRQSSASREVPVLGLVCLGRVRQEATGRTEKLRTALRVVNENAKKGRVDSELGPSFDEGHGTSSFRGTCCPFLYARRPRPSSASPPASSPQKQPPRRAQVTSGTRLSSRGMATFHQPSRLSCPTPSVRRSALDHSLLWFLVCRPARDRLTHREKDRHLRILLSS